MITKKDFDILWEAIENELRDQFRSASDVQVESVLQVVRSVALYTWNSAQENAIPSCCVVVPKEPTEEMMHAALISLIHKKCDTEALYKAMIEAAQEQVCCNSVYYDYLTGDKT